MRKYLVAMVIYALLPSLAWGQERTQSGPGPEGPGEEGEIRRHYIGSSLLVLSNFFPDPADFYQLTYGYHLSPTDVLIAEATT